MTIPTYGYSKDGEARLFHLAEDEDLPIGWFSSPGAAAAPEAPPAAPATPVRAPKG